MSAMWSVFKMSVVLTGIIVASSAGIRAEDDRVIDDQDAAVPTAGNVNRDPFDVVRVRHDLSDRRFYPWISASSDSDLREKVTRQLDDAVRMIDRKYGLSEDQRARLIHAGQAERRRYLEAVEKLKRRFQDTNGDQNAIRAISMEAIELRRWFERGLYGGGAVFEKVARGMLARDRSPDAIERRDRYHRSLTAEVVRDIGNGVELSDTQQESLATLLLTIPPPVNGGYDDRAILRYQLTAVPAENLRPLFDEVQWPEMQWVLDRFRSEGRILESQGIVLNDVDEWVRSAVDGSDRVTSAEKELE